tara:strand:+ start:1004 stop:1657 length:654 start_codon:yes stop_codon:yes gene_type:complete
MVVHRLGDENSLLNQFVSEIRNVDIQSDRLRFRRNMERIGEILGYEMSKVLDYVPQDITTPLGHKQLFLCTEKLVICSILRAGLPMHQGLLNYFDAAENAFVSAYRRHPKGEDSFEVVVNYFASPSLTGKVLVLTDPMLATGKTLENVLNALKPYGTPDSIHIISAIGSEAGLAHVQKVFPDSTHLWIAAVDPELTSKGYIVPGLGDAGDLSYGPKL